MTIEDLKESGLRTFMCHNAREDGGHVTRLAVVNPEKKFAAVTEAKCHPGDQFNRKIAREICLGRWRVDKSEIMVYDKEEDLRKLLDEHVYLKGETYRELEIKPRPKMGE